MKRISFIIIPVILVACSGNKSESGKELKPTEEIEMVEVDSVPNKNGEYLVTDEVFMVLQEEPENHFNKAKQNIASNELNAAANEIKKASVYLDLEISKAEKKDKEKLILAKDKLNTLTERLKKGEKVKEPEIGQAFYDANVALYGSYITQYDNITTNNKEKKGGNSYLDAALQKVENAEKWSSRKFDKETQKTIEEGKTLSSKFKTDLKEDKESIKKEWSDFLKKLKILDKKLEGNSDGSM